MFNRAYGHSAPAAPLSVSNLPEGGPARLLLVVDDEVDQHRIVRCAAEALGITADGAITLADAMERVRTIAYDVIVLDLGLGDRDGIELLRYLGNAGSNAVVVFVSGQEERVRQAAARLASALGLRVAGTLGKPVPVDQLVTLLRALPERGKSTAAGEGPAIDADLLEAAIESGEIACLFQPKVTLREIRLVGVEALARWRSPLIGRVRPERFIPLAERVGLIDRLTDCIMAQALAHFRPWRAVRPDLTLAVNLSPISLTDLSLPERISAALAESGVPPAALVVELTENAVTADYVTAADILTRLRIRGIKLSIDDFGTGHSSLLSLLRLPFSELKIDQRFVRSCLNDPEVPKIIRAVVSLAGELGLHLVAEGIETEPVAQMLLSLGCIVGQGNLFGRPLCHAIIANRLRAAA